MHSALQYNNTQRLGGAASVADRIKALLGNTSVRLWEKLQFQLLSTDESMVPYILSEYLTRFISCNKSVSVEVMLMVMCKNVAWLFQNALVLP